MLGEFLYRLTQMEAVTAPVLQRRLDNSQLSQAAANLVLDGPLVPPEKWALLTYVLVDVNAGAAQVLNSFDVFIVDSAGNEQVTLLRGYPAVQNFSTSEGHLEVYLAAGERLRARGFFNAGAAANILNLDAHMILLPKGNLQLR